MELGPDFWSFIFRWVHVLSGIMWIGLLYYFNFVQVPSMPQIPDEQKPAISKVIAPRALFQILTHVRRQNLAVAERRHDTYKQTRWVACRLTGHKKPGWSIARRHCSIAFP